VGELSEPFGGLVFGHKIALPANCTSAPEGLMDVAELRKALEGVDPKAQVVVTRETETLEFFEVTDASLRTGTPMRTMAGRAGFRFENEGHAAWLFISIEEA
jgi:hypothetical protein